jgi:hypothetical protein
MSDIFPLFSDIRAVFHRRSLLAFKNGT